MTATTLSNRPDVAHHLQRAKRRMKRKDLQRAQSRVRLAGILSEVASRPLADQRHMLNAAVQDMHTDELRAWTDYAEDLFEDLSREEDWKMFSLLGSGLTTAYSRLNREE